MSLQELEDKEAIREVIDRFSTLEIDVHEQAKLFTPDTKITIYTGNKKLMEINGNKDMEEKFGAAMANAKSSFHMNGQQVIELKNDYEAIYCQATIENEIDGENILNVSSIRYIDTLVKQEDKWLIASREQHIIFSEKRKYE